MKMIRTVFLLFVLLMTILPSPATAGEGNKIGDGLQPQVAVDPAGNVFVVYGQDKNIFCSASVDGGKSFGAPELVANAPGMMLGMRRGPRIAATTATVLVTAISGTQGGGKDGDVISWHSTDRGKSWKRSEKTVNSIAGSAREGLDSVAAGPENKFYCVWLDLRNNKTQVWGAGSSDGGQNWSQDQLIYKSPEGGTCPCCHPSVSIDAKGTINVIFRNDINGEKDMYITRSTDGGKTFSAAGKLGTGTWKLNACPMDGGAIAAGPDGTAVTIWRRQKNIFTAAPGKPERDLGSGEQPSISVGPDGVYAAWITSRPGAVMVLGGVGAPVKIADKGADPVIASSLDGKGPVVAAWASDNSIFALTIKPRK